MGKDKRRMRVAVYTDSVVLGGSEVELVRLVEGLPERFDLTVLGTDAEFVAGLAAVRPACSSIVLPKPRSKWDLGPVLAHLLRIRRAGFEVLHANLRTAWSCQYAIAAGQLSPRTAVSGTLHSILPPRNRRQAWLNGRALSRLDALVAISETAARALSADAGVDLKRIRVIENGVPERPAQRWRLRPGPVIGTVGRLAPEKRHEVLLEAVARLPDATGLLVGDGASLRRSRAARPRLESRTGWYSPAGRMTSRTGSRRWTCS